MEAPDEIQFAADRAILVALVINELVMNAGKYAYPNSSDGLIWVRLARIEKNSILVSVRDEGAGLPAGFDPGTSKRLGTRLVSALAKQLGAEVTRPVSVHGTNFTYSAGHRRQQLTTCSRCTLDIGLCTAQSAFDAVDGAASAAPRVL